MVRAALELEPRVGVRLLRGARWLGSRRVRHSLVERGQAYRTFATASDVFVVPPDSITRCASLQLGDQDRHAAVVAGDWDKPQKAFRDSDIYCAMKSVLKDKVSNWADTPWYAQIRSSLEGGQTAWGCRSTADFDRRIAEVERLYASGSPEGSVSPDQPGEIGGDHAEVGVAVGRIGELLVCDGEHLLCVASLLRMAGVTVRVRARHPGWATFRGELLAYAQSRVVSINPHCIAISQRFPAPTTARIDSR